MKMREPQVLRHQDRTTIRRPINKNKNNEIDGRRRKRKKMSENEIERCIVTFHFHGKYFECSPESKSVNETSLHVSRVKFSHFNTF